VTDRLARLLDELEDAGHLTGAWRSAFEAVPRELFVPASAWFGDDEFLAISRQDEPERWLDEVYTDAPIVTQMDDGRTPFGPPGDSPTSSLSSPTIVARMLADSQIEPGMTVLEIGTGSGWNAALLASRVGGPNVYTVEIDPDVMAGARASLTDAGWAPTTILADGASRIAGIPQVDRVLATCSVFRVPYAWVQQTKPGGSILLPWRSLLLNGLLLRLHVADDGTASGRFGAPCSFMALRAQRRPLDGVEATEPAEEETTPLHDDEIFAELGARLAIAVLVPDCDRWIEWDNGVPEEHLDDLATGSWAVGVFPDDGPYVVRQGGPRRLWDEIVSAYHWWKNAGEPDADRFGVTVGPTTQTVWLDDPSHTLAVMANDDVSQVLADGGWRMHGGGCQA
jgi:protein-L-isoaspartate O-methyltransferase